MLRNPQTLHAAVLGGLGHQPVEERVLWRLEAETSHRMTVLVLTTSTPSWEHLIEQAGWTSSDEPQALVRSYQPLLDRVERGREFAFRLRANPVSSSRKPDKPTAAQEKHLAQTRPRGVRVPHRTAAHQLNWLSEHVNRWGFELAVTHAGDPDVLVAARDRLVFTKTDGVNKQRVVLSTATFAGRIRVCDPAVARGSLLSGVGPARAYGCGLITLAPLSADSRTGG
jgi:CRISPR system Cascade subunit CasE